MIGSVYWDAGEQLSTGWDPILRILEAVPEAEDVASVGLAFQSVQLLASDYMSSLPPSLLRKCLEVAALYGAQQVRSVMHVAFCVCPFDPSAWGLYHICQVSHVMSCLIVEITCHGISKMTTYVRCLEDVACIQIICLQQRCRPHMHLCADFVNG